MASRVRRRLSSAQRREKILAAAVLAFAAAGYDETSMDRIAARAKISKPVLYDHFASKQALFLAVLESIRDDLLARGNSIVQTGSAPRAKFRAAVDAFLQFVERDPDAARVLLMVPRGDACAANLSRDVQAGASAGIARLLVSFMPGARPWRVQATTEFLKEGLHAVAEWWLENPGPSRADLVDVVMQVVWQGFDRKDFKQPRER
jgi:AcrR family transcriptional regulator